MKRIVKSILLESFSIYLLTQLFSGVQISDGVLSILLTGAVLTIIGFFMRPILGIITFPITILTLGALNMITTILANIIILFFGTVFVKQFSIHAFTITRFSFAGIIIPRLTLNEFFAFILVAFVYSLIRMAGVWLISE